MEPRALTPRDLRDIVSDPSELAKGITLAQVAGLAHPSRHADRLHAEARASGGAVYKVQIQLSDLARGRCSCMAARSRPFCKHAVALLYLWATQPGSFVVAAPPPPAAPEAGRREVRRGRVDGDVLVGRGVEQVLALVGELGVTGVSAASTDRAAQVRALAEPLRAHRLRRLSARVLLLAEQLALAGEGEAVDADAWADLLGDLLLSAKRIARHLAGETLEDRYVEELIGRSWTRKDRTPVSGLDLVELAWRASVTPDDFRIVESRHLDLVTGASWSEKQILPMALARRTEPRPSRAGCVLTGVTGSRFPGFAPFRLDIESPGTPAPLDEGALERLAGVCLPRVGLALTRFAEHRRDVFAPDLLPVAVRVDAVLAGTGRLRLVDASGDTLFLPEDRPLLGRVAEALRDATLEAAFGDVGIDGALPTLYPLALLVKVDGARRLVPLVGGDAASMRGKRPRRVKGVPGPRWVDVARAAGVSRAAVALGEAREELAWALARGTAGFSRRAAEPVAARLSELGLEKPAQVLLQAAALEDPRARIEELVKVYQVSGIALVRLAGAVNVDRAGLVAVPTYPSVSVPRIDEQLPPEEVARRVAGGRFDRFQAAVCTDAWYRALPPEALVSAVFPTWCDASASPFVARALAGRAQDAVAAAVSVLLVAPSPDAAPVRVSRTARLTAIRVLAAAGARTELERVTRTETDPGLHAHVRRALGEVGVAPPAILVRLGGVLGGRRAPPPVDPALRAAVLTAPLAEERAEMCLRMVAAGDLDAIPLLRVAWASDVTERVRAAAAYALAALVDLESADRFLEGLGARAVDDAGARVAARALGILGDHRALGPLLEAYAAGWHPQVCVEALSGLGRSAVDAIFAFLEVRPELAKRGGAQTLLEGLGGMDRLPERVQAIAAAPDFVARAGALLSLTKGDAPLGAAVARAVRAARPDLEGTADVEGRALFRRCSRLLPKG